MQQFRHCDYDDNVYIILPSPVTCTLLQPEIRTTLCYISRDPRLFLSFFCIIAVTSHVTPHMPPGLSRSTSQNCHAIFRHLLPLQFTRHFKSNSTLSSLMIHPPTSSASPIASAAGSLDFIIFAAKENQIHKIFSCPTYSTIILSQFLNTKCCFATFHPFLQKLAFYFLTFSSMITSNYPHPH